MIEHGTVIGNVSRSHKPCGACGALVDTRCKHGAPLPPPRPGRNRDVEADRQRASAARAARRAARESGKDFIERFRERGSPTAPAGSTRQP